MRAKRIGDGGAHLPELEVREVRVVAVEPLDGLALRGSRPELPPVVLRQVPSIWQGAPLRVVRLKEPLLRQMPDDATTTERMRMREAWNAMPRRWQNR